MKRTIITFITLGSLLLSSCFNQLTPDIPSGEEQRYQSVHSSVNITIFIPDYRKLAETGRAVAPQTAFVRLSVADGSGAYAQHGNLRAVDMNSLESVANAPAHLPGGIWKGTFAELDCKLYNAGSLKIELLDHDRRVITQGVNQDDVTVTKNQAAQAIFFTTPQRFNSVSGSLAIGEMRFWKVHMMGGYEYTLTVSAEGAYPDIVVFNDDGTFREYRPISNNERVLIFNPSSAVDCYMGVWADGAAVSSYSIALSYKFEDSREDFSAGLKEWAASATGTNAPLPKIVDEDGKSILEFDSLPMSAGGRANLSRTIIFSVPTALSFSYKTDIGGDPPVDTYFKLYIDGAEKASYAGLDASWKTGSFVIPAGSHEIKWVLEKDSNRYYPARTNKVWLADISFPKDVTAYVDIHPKGPKDTYVGGFAIPYTARALREDSLIRPGVSVVYSGVGVNPATGLFTPPATPGTYRVTASVDGKTASSDIITVHPADYLSGPYTNLATGKTYYGYEGGSGSMTPVTGVTFSRPAESNITADGFVTVEGQTQSSYMLMLQLTKDGNSSATTSYPLPAGKFSVRIWLRFGPGQYRITVGGQQVFTVTNTCTDTGADGGDPRFLYPSSVIQSDDFRITNRLTDILYGVSSEADRIKIIHDYLVKNTIYDYDSLIDRKPQDALSVLGTRYFIDTRYLDGHYLAVCEGYSLAAAALLRAAGIETRYVSSAEINHAWNQVFTGGSWKFLDVTWDDPTFSGTGRDGGPDYVRYDYYLLTTLDGVNGDHPGGAVNYLRSVVPVIPKLKGMPDGWY
jgi:transglutaminase-like putative cysteine protease